MITSYSTKILHELISFIFPHENSKTIGANELNKKSVRGILVVVVNDVVMQNGLFPPCDKWLPSPTRFCQVRMLNACPRSPRSSWSALWKSCSSLLTIRFAGSMDGIFANTGLLRFLSSTAPMFVFQWLYDEAQLALDGSGRPRSLQSVTAEQVNYILMLGKHLRKSLRRSHVR